MTGRLLSPSEVSRKLGISRTTLWRLERQREMPAGMLIGKRSKRWREEDIERFIEKMAVSA
ncbi:helix-turn-helix domain-containing protein [Aureimonas altamirensis]|uniref:helix-turn-helix transcriptional regulator n=1 Tax=Aureimonas altamirensis TaxID=370622 RepID=UPI001E589D52|nr:helix-turn-helix domain-containing protein [Aureimonas altamirensis]UHD45353.1 helix-turn-helix domain-containing protein [Aureimonas altamirensis]